MAEASRPADAATLYQLARAWSNGVNGVFPLLNAMEKLHQAQDNTAALVLVREVMEQLRNLDGEEALLNELAGALKQLPH